MPASFISKTLKLDESNEKYIKLNIWDTCGQEKYRSIGKVFYKGVNGVVFVYSINDRHSFEDIKNFWIKEMKNNAPKDINKS